LFKERELLTKQIYQQQQKKTQLIYGND